MDHDWALTPSERQLINWSWFPLPLFLLITLKVLAFGGTFLNIVDGASSSYLSSSPSFLTHEEPTIYGPQKFNNRSSSKQCKFKAQQRR
jgi:hypothetical protein